jgi:hypothetical protein
MSRRHPGAPLHEGLGRAFESFREHHALAA